MRDGLGSKRVKTSRDRIQEGQHQRATDQPIEQIAERQPAARGVVAMASLDQRIDRAAEIGAEDQRDRRRRA